MSFFDKWTSAVSEKRSILCAGLDLPLRGMGRSDERLPTSDQRLDWVIGYIDAVAPYVCAIKPNLKYWLYDPQFIDILSYIKQKKLLLIIDSKIADIDSTNDAEYYCQSLHHVDAVTISPFAGNIRSTVADCLSRNLGCFVMGLMSNPEYQTAKNALVPIAPEAADNYASKDIVHVGGQAYVKAYIYLTHEAVDAGASGLVVGTTDHITDEEIKTVRDYSAEKTLYLCPGVGSQGGNINTLKKIIPPRQLIISISRGLMFPNKDAATPESQRKAAAAYHEAFRPFLD